MQFVSDHNPAREATLVALGVIVGSLLLILPDAEQTNPHYRKAPQIIYSSPSPKSNSPAIGMDKREGNGLADSVQSTAEAIGEAFNVDSKRAERFATWIYEAKGETGVPIELMAALIATESSFRYSARSGVGAVGPTQVRPRFWSEHCGGDLLDPRNNVICGAKVLAHYRDRCPDWSCALKMYNVGPTGYQLAEFEPAKERYIAKIHLNLERLGKSAKSYFALAER